MPRKSKLTPAVIKTIAKHVGNGLTNKDACRLAGVTARTFYRWLEAAEEAQSGLLLDLKEAMMNAEAEFKDTHLALIRKAASEPSRKTHRETITEGTGKDAKKRTKVTIEEIDPPWQASAWLLERKYPREFAVGKRRK